MNIKLRKKLSARLFQKTGPNSEVRSPDPSIQEHFEVVPSILMEVLQSEMNLKGARVLELGCGPGLTALGLAVKADPSLIAAMDLSFFMSLTMEKLGVSPLPERLPNNLHFLTGDASRLPLSDRSFDLIYSWSVFEHLTDPMRVLTEAKRVLKDQGLLYIQISPLYYSRHGSHLWEYTMEPFAHLRRSNENLKCLVLSGEDNVQRRRIDWNTFIGLNRMTIAGLQDGLKKQGFSVVKAIIENDDLNGVSLCDGLSDYPLQDLSAIQINIIARKD